MGDIIRQNAGLLKIAFPTMRGTYMLPCTLPIFRSLYPHVRLEIREAHSSLLEGMLLNGDADLAFFNLPVKTLILIIRSSVMKKLSLYSAMTTL